MKKYVQMTFIFALLALFLDYIDVDAKTVQFNVCSDSRVYSIIYDTNINTQVTKEKIMSNQNLLNIGYVDGVRDKAHKFNVSTNGVICYSDGYSVVSCPPEGLSYADVSSKYYYKTEKQVGKNKTNVEETFDVNTGRFIYKFKDAFNGQVKIRLIRNNEMENGTKKRNSVEDGKYKTISDYSADQFYNFGNSFVVNPDEGFVLEFYVNASGKCNGTYIGSVSMYAPGTDFVYIDNPAVKNPAAYGCDNVKNWAPAGMQKSSDFASLKETKEKVVHSCYDKTIKYLDRGELGTNINKQFNALKELYRYADYSSYSSSSSSSSCNNLLQQSKSSTYSESGSYWAINCSETYTAVGDVPKLVKAGGGFEYQSTFTIEKQCSVVQIAQPVMKPQCHKETTCTGNHGGGDFDVTGTYTTFGPNEDFDKCIKNCDNGKYTQNCINSCYNDVYSHKKRNLSFMDVITGINNTSDVVTIGACGDDGGGPEVGDHDISSIGEKIGERSGAGWHANIYQFEDTTCDVDDRCGDAGYGCTCHTSIVPDGCSWCPEAEYAAEMAVAQSELSKYNEKADSYTTSTGNYEYVITDSYYNQGTYKFIVNDQTNPMIYRSDDKNSHASDDDGHTQLGASSDSPVDYKAHASRKTTITLGLPVSYINKLTADAAYKTDEGNSSGYYIIDTNSSSSLKQVTKFGIDDYYHTSGERKYYTSVQSPDINVYYANNNVYLNGGTNAMNIAVTSSGLGDGDFGSTINCYYGVYNSFYDFNPGGGACDPTKEVCDGGIQYIFRPIVLSDVFPNGREPRFNWSSKAIGQGSELYNTKVDPVMYTKTIEAKQEEIYNSSNGEIDYEFILTPKNIAAIKKYNKSVSDFNKDGARNYLDYDLSCYKRNGREICTSRFLDDTGILMYGSGYTVDNRKSIAGCNNAKDSGTSCDTSAHQ